MRLQTFHPLWALAAWAWCLAAQAGDDAPEPVLTRHRAFAIPFRFPQPDPSAQAGQSAQSVAQGVEVELSVSRDRGETWNVYATAKPPQTNFSFRSAEDGEYWFSVRTRGPSGKRLPDGPAKVELRVIVDTSPPQLLLAARRGPSGDLEAELNVSDPNLKPDTLLLEYQVSGLGERWHTVAIDPIPADAAGPAHRGQIAWRPEKAAAAYVVRARIADRAGNPTVAQANVDENSSTSNPAGQLQASPSPPRNRPDAGPQRRQPQTPLHPPSDDPDPFHRATRPRTTLAPYGGFDGERAAEPASEQQPPIDGTTDSQIGAAENRWPPDETTGDGQESVLPGRPRMQYRAAASQAATDGAFADLPKGVRPRMINSTQFELQYDVDSVGPWGIRKVELWGTRDAGRNWTALGDDSDNQSPLIAKVPGEGLYGFRILVQSGSGMVELPPRAGDLPELWIGIDLTPPTGRITHVEQGGGERAGQLIIDWEANDNLPMERPISLAFSEQPDGPWTTVVSGLRNSGRYVWQLEQRVPEQIYLRIEVRDEAGNAAVWTDSNPVHLDRLLPKGRILDVRPVPGQ